MKVNTDCVMIARDRTLADHCVKKLQSRLLLHKVSAKTKIDIIAVQLECSCSLCLREPQEPGDHH